MSCSVATILILNFFAFLIIGVCDLLLVIKWHWFDISRFHCDIILLVVLIVAHCDLIPVFASAVADTVATLLFFVEVVLLLISFILLFMVLLIVTITFPVVVVVIPPSTDLLWFAVLIGILIVLHLLLLWLLLFGLP